MVIDFRNSVDSLIKNGILLFGFLTSLNTSAQNWSVSTGGNSLKNGSTNEYGPTSENLLWSGGKR